jgi:hypothetical protein
MAAGLQGAGFSERIRFYDNQSDVDADSDLGVAVKGQLTAMLSAKIPPQRVAAGRLEANVAQVDNILITAGVLIGDIYDVTINGTAYQHVALAAPTPASISAALQVLIDADPDISAVDNVGDIDTTATPAGLAVDIVVAYTAAGGGTSSITVSNTTPNVGPFTELSAILAADNTWYGFVIDRRTDVDILEAARWNEANKRLFMGQSSAAGIKSAVSTTDVAYIMQSRGYDRSALLFYGDDGEFADAAWMGFKLAADLDSEATDNSVTIWIYANLIGIPVDSGPAGIATTTDKTAVLAKNANVYLTFNSTPATGDGTLASGRPIDQRTTLDWLETRMFEDLANALLQVSNSNSKIPLTAVGIGKTEGLILTRLELGENIGHLTPGSSRVTVPVITSITAADRTAGILRASFKSEFSGAIIKIPITGSVVAQLTPV